MDASQSTADFHSRLVLYSDRKDFKQFPRGFGRFLELGSSKQISSLQVAR